VVMGLNPDSPIIRRFVIRSPITVTFVNSNLVMAFIIRNLIKDNPDIDIIIMDRFAMVNVDY